jgi:predicted O-methyltransferase YrrM
MPMHDNWDRVETYFIERLGLREPALDAALADNAAAGLPAIDVAPNAGMLLHILARMVGARRILEIGTLGGYSTIWLARALPPEGRLVTLEYAAAHAEVARANIARAGLVERVEIRVGAALDSLPGLAPLAPFDFVFIDADKENNAAYLDWALRLTRPGAAIVCDNVVRGGRVADMSNSDPGVLGTRSFFDRLAAEPRVTATAIQTVGGKGWDGFAIAFMN